MSAIIYDDAPLEERIHRSLSDTFKHRAIERAQDVITSKRDALVAEVDNWEDFRTHAAEIRDHVLSNLDYYIKTFAANAEKNGAHVYFAPTGEDALETILDIFEDAGATSCVKSKSMMTEEIGLNAFLHKHGINAVETDCAENIIQVAGNAPPTSSFPRFTSIAHRSAISIAREKVTRAPTILRRSLDSFVLCFAPNS